MISNTDERIPSTVEEDAATEGTRDEELITQEQQHAVLESIQAATSRDSVVPMQHHVAVEHQTGESSDLELATTQETEQSQMVTAGGDDEQGASGNIEEDDNIGENQRSVACQTEVVRSSTTSGNTSSDHSQLAVPKQYHHTARVRDRRAG